jgi:cyclase
MREIADGVFVEDGYPGVHIGVVRAGNQVLLVDCPLRVDDCRDWLARVAEIGRPRYLALLDSHPDRVLGARNFDLPIIAHDATRLAVGSWPDTFKGASHPIGADADRLKRITGVARAVPDLTFSDSLTLQLGERRVECWHQPGPTPGAMWIVVPDARVAFIGDLIRLNEPPYIGEAEIDCWLDSLSDLRQLKGYRWVTSHDGIAKTGQITSMGRFLRKIPVRLERLSGQEEPLEAASSIAPKMLKGMHMAGASREQGELRLVAGLARLYSRRYETES